MTLALDTSHATGSVALTRDRVALGEIRFEQPSSHLVELARAVERLLATNGLTMREVDRIAVVLGPGSFTGVRIALSFAKGLSAAGAEVVAMDSLRLLSLPLFEEGHGRVCAMIDAKRGEVYAAVFERATAHSVGYANVVEVVAARAESPVVFLDSLPAAPDVFVGSGVLAHRDAVTARFPKAKIAGEERAFPSTAYLASIAHHMPELSRDEIRALEPVYLRASGAERVRLRSHAREKETNGDD